jgi:hypothetical protein
MIELKVMGLSQGPTLAAKINLYASWKINEISEIAAALNRSPHKTVQQ